ncbi:hypothetical protein [Henriciella sp.]|uniref:hypothetical protein n=1 Tax=Henriciella sp. TaxID=1968823 RepID=UPI00261D8E30|nr:hypothetical protein [Henriciella sp.]
MKRALMTATAALAFAATPAFAQVVGGEAEVDTDTQIETDFANDGAQTRTGVSTDVKIDPDNEMADWAEDAEPTPQDGQGGPYATDRDDASQRYGTLAGEPEAEAQTQMTAETSMEWLSEYEIDQLQKAGAADQIDTLEKGDGSY